MFQACRPVIALTGAGLSTASGIPAYRDAEGRWRRGEPIRHQAFVASASARQRYWARSFAGWPQLRDALPNAAHHALAALEADGWLNAIITQNVDGLHARAGSRQIVELHGTLHWVVCLGCGARHPREAMQDWLAVANPHWAAVAAKTLPDGDAALTAAVPEDFKVPGCPACGGVLKPDVVFFGDAVPRQRVETARALIAAAGMLLVVGSSLMVYSGYRLVDEAHGRGKPVVAINQGMTRADDLLDLKLDGDCVALLPALVARLKTAC